jgi:hypothetical protein
LWIIPQGPVSPRVLRRGRQEDQDQRRRLDDERRERLEDVTLLTLSTEEGARS